MTDQPTAAAADTESARSPLPAVIHLPDASLPLPAPMPPPSRKAVHGSEKRERSGQLIFRVTAAERETIAAEAQRSGLTVASYARAQVLKAAPLRAVRRPAVEMEALGKALGLLGLYGSNVNQLARVANSEGGLPTEAALLDMAQHIHALRDALMQALGKRTGS